MFREVSMAEVKEVLRLWQMGRGNREIERLIGVNRKTVRRYVEVAVKAGLERGLAGISDEVVGAVVEQLRPGRPFWHGESWADLESQRAFIKERLENRLRLTKIEVLLRRRGVVVPYRTLHRFCVTELGFGNRGETVPVADGEPGHELQIDFGRLGLIGIRPPRRVTKGLIFTAGVSRHTFCWPTFGESLEEVIEGFEEAWLFFGGYAGDVCQVVGRVTIPAPVKTDVGGHCEAEFILELVPLDEDPTIAGAEYVADTTSADCMTLA